MGGLRGRPDLGDGPGAGRDDVPRFHVDEAYERPVWPSVAGHQQMQLHLDVGVADIEAAVADAVQLGATVADVQPQDAVRVMLDPDGHPFCLYLDGD